MIQEIINLGIKGSDLIVQTLDDIQKKKEVLGVPSKIDVGLKDTSIFGKIEGGIKGVRDLLKKSLVLKVKTEVEKGKKEKEEKEKTQGKASEVVKATGGALMGAATLSGASALRGVAGMANMISEGIAKSADGIITAVEAFRENIESAARINANAAESFSRASNIIAGEESGDRKLNFTGRTDIDIGTRRALVEELGARYGIVQRPFLDAVKKLYTTKEGKAADVMQAAQLQAGQFSALGTDKGFFMQKIADQLQGLPPTMKAALMTPLVEMVQKENRFEQYDTKQKQDLTRLETNKITQAAEKTKKVGERDPVDQAIRMTEAMTTLDTKLNTTFSQIVYGLDGVLSEIERKLKQFNLIQSQQGVKPRQ